MTQENPIREMWRDFVVGAPDDFNRGAAVVFIVIGSIIAAPFFIVLWGLGRLVRLVSGRR